MPRLRQVPRAEAHPTALKQMYKMLFGDERDPVAEPGTATGTPGNWWTVFALCPTYFDHAVAGFHFYRSQRKLDPKLRELGQTRAGWARGSQFVFSQHCKAAAPSASPTSRSGHSAWQTRHDCYSRSSAPCSPTPTASSSRAAGSPTASSTPSAQAPRRRGDPRAHLHHLTYEMHAMMSRALRLEYDDVDEPVVEIAAPAGARTLDAMRRVDR